VVNVAANLHLVASMPRAFILEYRKTPSPLISRLSKKPLMYEDGCLKIPSDPGLGIEIDYSVVEECKIK
jgi:L-alanine-DL-glutamate epimerase-like enolase superfamily enzyme